MSQDQPQNTSLFVCQIATEVLKNVSENKCLMKDLSTLPPSNDEQGKPSWILRHLSVNFLDEQWSSSTLAASLTRRLDIEQSFICLSIYFLCIFGHYLLLSFEIVVRIKVPWFGFPRHTGLAKSILLSNSRIATLSLNSTIFAPMVCWDKSPMPTLMVSSEPFFLAARKSFENDYHLK